MESLSFVINHETFFYVSLHKQTTPLDPQLPTGRYIIENLKLNLYHFLRSEFLNWIIDHHLSVYTIWFGCTISFDIEINEKIQLIDVWENYIAYRSKIIVNIDSLETNDSSFCIKTMIWMKKNNGQLIFSTKFMKTFPTNYESNVCNVFQI